MNDFTVMPDETAFTICQKLYRDEYDACTRRISMIMGWAPSKATTWMTTKNPLLGNVTPVSIIAHGHAQRLDKFITEAEKIPTE